MEFPQLRQALVDTAVRMGELGLNKGTSGNLSVRLPDDAGLLLTPSAVPPAAMGPQDVIRMDFDGGWQATAPGRKPTTEWRFHRDILRARPEIGAAVHTHAPFCTALSTHRIGIPPFHYLIALAGGNDVRCSAYAAFGTQALSDAVLAALQGRKACLMANHGMLALGPDLARALALAVEVENLAEGYWRARQLGEPVHLSEAEMAEVHARIAGYGSTADPDDGVGTGGDGQR